jgi:hypothetical protein
MTPVEITGFAAIIAGTIGLGLACWAQRREIERISERSGAFLEDAFVFREALRAIAAMETPRANATVKRMAKTARAALEGLNIDAQATRIAGLELEVSRLKLDVATQEALQASAYRAGMKHGWNCCDAHADEAYRQAMQGTEHIAELKRIREARATLNGGNHE